MTHMGYNPKKYKDLFPLGLFEFESKPVETWFDSHRLFALNAVPLKEEEKELAPGLTLKKGHINQGKGFSNYMIFEIDPEKRKLEIEYFKENMYYPLEAFEKLKDPKLVTNAGYFYLTDDEKRDPVAPPKVRSGNLVIKNGEIINLPVLDRSAVLILKNGSLNIKFLEAHGLVSVGGKKFKWVGSKSGNKKEDQIIIYNSSNIEIPVINDPVMGPSRRAKETYITPDKDYILAVCQRTNGEYKLTGIFKDKVLINDKDMVIAIPEKIGLKEGDILKFESVDGMELKDIESAISTGPMLFTDYQKTLEEVEKEFSISDMANPTNPHEETKNLARGCLVKLKDSKLCSIIIDGIPQAGDIYPGVTLKEFVKFIGERYPDYESAIATDPSSSVKAVFKEEGKTEVFGNLHYLAHEKDEKGNISFWPNGTLGRKFNSALVVY